MAKPRYIETGIEASYGTFSGATHYLDVVNESLRTEKEISPAPRGAKRWARQGTYREGPIKLSGGVELGPINPNNCGRLLKAFFGGITSDQIGVTSAWDNLFTPTEDSLPSLSLDIGVDTEEWRYLGAFVDSLDINMEEGGDVTLSAGLAGLSIDPTRNAAPDTPTFQHVADEDFDFSEWYTASDTGYSNPAGGVDARLTALSLSLRNNAQVERRRGGNRYVARAYLPRKFECSGRLSFDFDGNLTQFNSFINNTVLDLALQFKGGIITGAENYRLYIRMPRVRYMADPVTHIDRRETAVQDIAFVAEEENTVSSLGKDQVLSFTGPIGIMVTNGRSEAAI